MKMLVSEVIMLIKRYKPKLLKIKFEDVSLFAKDDDEISTVLYKRIKSGYYWYYSDNDELVIECGAAGNGC